MGTMTIIFIIALSSYFVAGAPIRDFVLISGIAITASPSQFGVRTITPFFHCEGFKSIFGKTGMSPNNPAMLSPC